MTSTQRDSSSREFVLSELVALSRNIGRPEAECAILGEGNTSAKIDSRSFLVKASGTQLSSIDEAGFVEIRFAPVLELLTHAELPNQAVSDVYGRSQVERETPAKPSVETLLHAYCLSLEGIRFVAHTHPTAVNMLTCSTGFPQILRGRIYPDEIVCLGADSVCVPYTDPGFQLGREVKHHIERYLEQYGEVPKVVYMQNHGLIALGASRKDAENITFTTVKAASIRFGALMAGGIRRLSLDEVAGISERTDEKYRRRMLER